MAMREVKWTSKTFLSCAHCSPPADVVLSVTPAIIAPGICFEQADTDETFAYSTIDAKLTKTCRTNSLTPSWDYTFLYDDAQLISGEYLVAADVLGAFCKGTLSEWVEDRVGNEVHIRQEEDGSFVLVSQHGCEYPFNVPEPGEPGEPPEDPMGLLQIVVPEDFGAIGNGLTDDTVAIQDAFNSGKAVFLNVGKVYAFSILTIPSGLFLFGFGTLKRKTTSGIAAAEHYVINAVDAHDWSIQGVTFDGNRLNQTGDVGFKVSGLLVRGCSNFRIHGTTWKQWHEDCIEMTCATQGVPVDADTPPPDPSDTIRRGRITSNVFLDSGRNENDFGFGHSTSRALQVGSTCVEILISNNLIRNCMGGIQCAAYNRHLVIVGNTLYVDSVLYAFRSSGIAVEQMSVDCVVSGNVIEGYQEGILLESCSNVSCTGNRIKGEVRGIAAFGSNISGTPIDMSRISIVGNTIEINSIAANTEAIRVVKSAGNASMNHTITGNVVKGSRFAIRTQGNIGLTVSGNEVSDAETGITSEANFSAVISGNSVSVCVNEGIWLSAGNKNLSVSGNRVHGCNKGIDIAAGQLDVAVHGNFLVDNSTGVLPFDFRVQSPSVNMVRHFGNRFESHDGAQSTITISGSDLRYGGESFYLETGIYSGFIGHHAGQRITFVSSQANVTYAHNSGPQKIFMKSGANVIDPANVGRTFISDGINLYEC